MLSGTVIQTIVNIGCFTESIFPRFQVSLSFDVTGYSDHYLHLYGVSGGNLLLPA